MIDTSVEFSTQKQKKAILLDFDGTAAPTLGLWVSAWRGTLAFFDVHVDQDEAKRICFSEDLRDFLPKHSIPYQEFMEVIWPIANELMASTNPYEGFHEFVEGTEESEYELAIVSNSRRDTILPILDSWNVTTKFSAIVTLDDVPEGRGKPHPDPINLALQRLTVPPENAFMVGDSTADVKAARSAGVRGVVIYHNENRNYHDGGL